MLLGVLEEMRATDLDTPRATSCSRSGCTRPAEIHWASEAGVFPPLCAEDATELFRIASGWLGESDARVNVEKYATAVERVVGRGLYQRPQRWNPPADQV